MRVDSLYICPWSLHDPLCRSQSLAYIRGLTKAGYSFALVTFENEKFELSGSEYEAEKRKLADENIHWYPALWNSGTSLSSKLSSTRSAVMTGIKVVRKHRPNLVHSRSSLPLPVALILRKLFRLKFLYDADSVLSEEYADVGHISDTGTGFKLLAKSESLARRSADRMIVLTETLRKRFLREGEVTVPIDVIPCCVDTARYTRSEDARQEKRSALGVGQDQKLLIYVGKPGSWYLVDETFAFFNAFQKLRADSKLLILTQADPAVFHELAERNGVAASDNYIRKAAPTEVPDWLSAADAGLSLIRQVNSKRGSSPIKFAEYLSCGLPVVTTDGIGDCTDIVLNNGVGVVLPVTDGNSLLSGAESLNLLLDQDTSELRNRCRQTAETLFSLERVGRQVYLDIYAELIGAAE